MVCVGVAVVAASIFAADSLEESCTGASEGYGEKEEQTGKVVDTVCSICFYNYDDEKHVPYAFDCGHTACGVCSAKMNICHTCRKPIKNRLRLYLQ
mmetsp:Transcript_3345/g.6377  ORF Transcript_3345/g.6377 Transcript_3345/m.6377 type:complete len:96 (-) Transcript_3345:2235-2522(-)